MFGLTWGILWSLVAIGIVLVLHFGLGVNLVKITLLPLYLVLFLIIVVPIAIWGFFYGAADVGTAYHGASTEYYKQNSDYVMSQDQFNNLMKGPASQSQSGGGTNGNGQDQVVSSGQIVVQQQNGQAAIVALPTQWVPKYQKVLVPDAGVRWFKTVAGCIADKSGDFDLICMPPNWLKDVDQTIAPVNSTSATTCIDDKCNMLDVIVADQIWEIDVTLEDGTTIKIKANGFFAADVRSFHGDYGKVTTMAGLGEWKRCTTCFQQVLTNPQPTTPAVAAPAATPVPAALPAAAAPVPTGNILIHDFKNGSIDGYCGWGQSIVGQWNLVETCTSGKPDGHTVPKDQVPAGTLAKVPAP